MNNYSWQFSLDEAVADQMVAIGANMSVAPFKVLLGISADDAALWSALAAEQLWLQKHAIPDSYALYRAYVGARDTLTHGPDRTEYVRPTVPAFDGPTPPAGVEIFNDFYDWANLLVKEWKLKTAFTEALQRQMGLEVKPETETADVPLVRSVKMQSGGVVTVDVFKGRAPGVIIQLNVDGAGWPDVMVGGANQKTPPGSRATFQLVPGAAHALQIREAFADRAGNMIGDWSEVKSASSLA